MPEVAAAYPRASHDRKTWTFRLRTGFRFSNGAPVRAERVRACDQPDALTADHLAGAPVHAGHRRRRRRPCGTSKAARGVVARGTTLVVRFTRPVRTSRRGRRCRTSAPSRPVSTSTRKASTSSPPPGRTTWPTIGPEERVVIRRNRYYGGSRPHHVDGFDVDVRPGAAGRPLDLVERGEADWGYTTAPIYLDPGRNLSGEVRREQVAVLPPARTHVAVLLPELLSPAVQGQPEPSTRREPRAEPHRALADNGQRRGHRHARPISSCPRSSRGSATRASTR